MTIADWAPRHVRPYVEAVIAAIQADPRVVGLTAGGSAATGTMDEFSDLDLVVVCRDEHQPELLRDAPAFAAGLGPLLACFTGEHVGEPRLLIALYGPPPVHVDLKFVADSQLDQRVEDGLILWQRDGVLDAALRRAALRAMVFGPLIARDGGHRAAGVRRLEQMAPGLVPALEATVGDHTAHGCAAALRASAALYRQLRGDAPALVRRTSAEAASLDYLAQIEAVACP